MAGTGIHQKLNLWIKGCLFLSAAFLVSCLTSSDGGGDFLPLAVGNRWRMVDYQLENGLLKAHDTSEIHVSSSVTISVGGQSLQAYRINWYYPLSPQEFPLDSVLWIERMESDGLSLYGFSHGTKDTVIGKTPDVKYPASIGQTWDRKFFNWLNPGWSSPTITEIEMAQADTLISTPAGNFHCFGVRSGAQVSGWFYEYYSVGVGPVAYKTTRNDTLVSKSLLLNYSLN